MISVLVQPESISKVSSHVTVILMLSFIGLTFPGDSSYINVIVYERDQPYAKKLFLSVLC